MPQMKKVDKTWSGTLIRTDFKYFMSATIHSNLEIVNKPFDFFVGYGIV